MAIPTSAQTLIVGVFQMLGITAQGEQPTADELWTGFARLNEMVDGWGLERLTHQVTTRTVYPLVAGQASYTIGPAGTVPTPDWIGPRPTFVEAVALVLTIGAPPYTETPLGELTDRAALGVAQKDLTSTQPTTWLYQETMPAGTFTFWPVPSVATNPVAIYTQTGLAQFADLVTTYTLAPGYMRALRYNLAREIAHEFGKELAASLDLLAQQSLAAVQAANVPMLDLRVPFVHGGRYNIFTDTSG